MCVCVCVVRWVDVGVWWWVGRWNERCVWVGRWEGKDVGWVRGWVGGLVVGWVLGLVGRCEGLQGVVLEVEAG